MSLCPFNASKKEIQKINLHDKCPHVNNPVHPTTTNVGSLTLVEAKQQYYYLWLKFLPSIMKIIRGFRKDFPFGLVKYKDGVTDGTCEDIVSATDTKFEQEFKEASGNKDFLRCSYLVHNLIAVSVDIATNIWMQSVGTDDPYIKRLIDLVDPDRKEKFGQSAAQKRVSSAMIQTMHISASLERFIYLLYCGEHAGKEPSAKQIYTFHRKTQKTALSLTEFHLVRTRELRHAFGAKYDGGIVHRYTDPSYFFLSKERLELKEGVLSEKMATTSIESGDGRIGCPGKKHIPEIWKWIEEVSAKYSYPVLL